MKGFTLIELMITVAIVGILAAIAYPSYVEHVNRSRRADAQATLMELAQWLEKNYMLNSKYNKDSQNQDITKISLQALIQGRTVLSYYNFDASPLTTLTATAFTLSFTPIGAQVNDKCGTLTLDNLGQKGVSKLDVKQCW